MQEREFLEKVRSCGGRVFIAGGWVRDKLRGALPKDKDYVITGLAEPIFCRIFPAAAKVGKSFPVYLLSVDGRDCEIAFARTEKKTGAGYRGFAVNYDETVTIEEDLYRRDTTMNSMALELPDEQLIDPYGGQQDVKRRLIRATSRHFCEDPVRALQAARQAAELDFAIELQTLGQMRQCAVELSAEPTERLFQELVRALGAARPSLFFIMLDKAGLLASVFPELHALRGQRQPAEFHPEGDAFVHSLQVLDQTAGMVPEPFVRFAALVHDLGKGLTPKNTLPHHYGHEHGGLLAMDGWARRMTFPRRWLQAAEFVICEHMRAPRLKKPGKVVALLLKAAKNPIGIAGLKAIILADHKSLPFYLAEAETYIAAIHAVSAGDCPATLQGREIGSWLRQQQIAAYIKAAVS